MANISNCVLYAVFAVAALFAGAVLNTIGPRWTMLVGTTGYPVYIGSLWYFDVQGHLWFPIFGGAYLGLAAACLSFFFFFFRFLQVWRAIQWCGNATGAVVGASVALGVSWNSTSSGVPHAVYIVFIVLQILSMGLALILLPADRVRRPDGTSIALFDPMPLMQSLRLTFDLFKDWRIVLMIPTFFTPEIFFPFQSSMNAYAYTLRARTLNGLLNNAIQLPITIFVGMLLDYKRLGGRRKRMFLGITFVMVWVTGAYIAQTIWLHSWKFNRSIPGPNINYNQPSYGGAVVIYMIYAGQYGIYQNLVLYLLGTLTNDPRKSAAIGGFFVACKSMQ